MNYTDVLARADELRLNSIDDEQKARWVFEFECRVAEVMGAEDPVWVFPSYEELLLPERYVDLYVKYLSAAIDAAQGEGETYANDRVIFEDAWSEFKSWWIRHNRPASGGQWKVW